MKGSDIIDKFVLDFEEGTDLTIRGATAALWSSIIESSPVDEGRFRGNWFATFGDTEKVTNSKDKSGAKTIANATSSVLKQKNGSKFTLTNNLPYAQTIEFGGYPGDGPETIGGFSKQAPQGVIRVNVKRFSDLLEKEAKKRLPK